MTTIEERRDVMLVCLNGHVITDRLSNHPDASRGHCERCGAATLLRCFTCGTPLPGAANSEFLPVGRQRPPDFCSGCGSPFPWASRHGPPDPLDLLGMLELLLRRLPLVIRGLRTRHGNRPPFRVEDEHDVIDLLRGLMLLHFEEVRPHQRTPAYSATNRTDLWLLPDRVALTVKCCTAEVRESELDRQWQEDVAYYSDKPDWPLLIGLVHDPERRITDPASWERAWGGSGRAWRGGA